LTNLLDAAIRRAGENVDLDSLPKPSKVQGNLNFEEVLKDFKKKLDTWVDDQNFKADIDEEYRAAGNTQTLVKSRLMMDFPEVKEFLVDSLIAEKMDNSPNATSREIYDYVAGRLNF